MEYGQANIIQQMIHQAVEDLVPLPPPTVTPPKSSPSNTTTIPSVTPSADISSISEMPSVQQANATMSRTQQMMKQMQDMMKQNMETLKNQLVAE